MSESDSSRLVKDMHKNMLMVKRLELAFHEVLEAFLVPDPVRQLDKALLYAEGLVKIHEKISETAKVLSAEMEARRPLWEIPKEVEGKKVVDTARPRPEIIKGEDEEPEEGEKEPDKGYNVGYCPRCCREKAFDYADILKEAYTCPHCGAEFLLMDLVLHSIRHKARMEGWENRSACETGEECKMPHLLSVVLDDETSEFLEELDSMWVFGEKIALEAYSRIKSFDDIEFVWANKEQPEKPAWII